MKKVVKWLLLLALLPLFANAQTSINIDSALAAEKEAAEVDTSTVEAAPKKVHYLWDQEVPVSVDSLDDEENDNALVLRQVPASLIKEFKADKKLQYIRKNQKKPDFAFMQAVILFIVMFLRSFYWVLIILILVALGFILYNYLKSQGYVFFGKGAMIDDGTITLAEEEMDLGMYEKQVQDAIANGRYRLAVRMLYLQTLRLLADKEVIILSKEKTNATYLRDISRTKWYKSFATLTLDYEYIWYGEVPVNDMQFASIHKGFSQFMNDLGYTR